MCRAILNFFLGIITVVLLVVTVSGSVAYFSLTNPEYHKQNILDSGFYSFAANRTEQYINSTALPTGVSNQATDEILEGVPPILVTEFTADKIQIIAENNINNISSYFNGRFSNVVIYLPVSRVRGLVSEIYEQIRVNLNEIIANRPVCAEGEEPDASIHCVPADAKEQGAEQLLPEEYRSEEKVLETLVTAFPLLDSELDEFTIAQLGGVFNFSENDTNQLVTSFARTKELYDTSRIVVICVWAINIALILLFVLTLPKGFRAKVSKLSFWLALVGLGIFFTGIFTAVGGSWLVNEAITANSNLSAYYIGLDTVVRAFMNISLSKFYQQLLFSGAALLFVGVVLFMLIAFTKRKTVTTVIVEPSAPITI
jgi:hypothetical protein